MAIGNSQQSVVKFTRFIIFTALASCVLAAIQATTGRFFFLAAKGMEDAAAVDEIAAQAGRAFGFFGNPNGLANWLAIPIAVTLARIVYPPSEGGNMKAKIWLPVLLGGMVLTASRSGYAITVLIIVLVFGHRVFKPKVTLITICSLLLCAVALRLMAPEFVEGVTQRVTRSTANDARWYLLRVGLNACMESPIFGLGLSSYPILSGFHAAHNGFLEPFVELGGFGYLPAMLGIGGGIFCGWRCAFIARKTNYEWLWLGWAAGITGLALSEMLHGIGWRTSLLWSMFAILYTSLLVLKQQRDTGQLVASR